MNQIKALEYKMPFENFLISRDCFLSAGTREMIIHDEEDERREGIDFHIKHNDYFGTLAAILDLVSQEKGKMEKEEHNMILEKLRKDLLYLQKNYRITKKTGRDISREIYKKTTL